MQIALQKWSVNEKAIILEIKEFVVHVMLLCCFKMAFYQGEGEKLWQEVGDYFFYTIIAQMGEVCGHKSEEVKSTPQYNLLRVSK